MEFHVRQVHYIPDTYMLTTFSSSIRDVDGMPVIYASQGLLNPVNRAVKSFADYAVSLTALVILSPRMRKNFGGEILTLQEFMAQRQRFHDVQVQEFGRRKN